MNQNHFTKAYSLKVNSGHIFLIKHLAEDHTESWAMQFKGQALSDQGPLKASEASEMKAG